MKRIRIFGRDLVILNKDEVNVINLGPGIGMMAVGMAMHALKAGNITEVKNCHDLLWDHFESMSKIFRAL